MQDVRYAYRALRKHLAFTFVATATLALGIGALTAIFSVVNAVLVRPLPYEEPGRLAMLWESNESQGLERSQIAPGNLGDWREQNQTFEGIAGFWPNSVTIRDRDDNPTRVKSALVTVDLFPLLGAEAALGRTFTGEEGEPGAPSMAILSHGLWQGRFGSDPAMLNQTVTIEEIPTTVVGVMPPGFAFPEEVDLWTNVNFPLQGRFGRWLNAIGRVQEGTTLEAAAGDLQALTARMADEYPNSNQGWGSSLAPLHEVVVGDTRPALMILLGATGAVLLIACANVANLLLTQSEMRHTEIAVRAALGAGRGRLIRQLLTESIALATLGSLLGVGLAWAGLRAVVMMAPAGLPRLDEIGMDTNVLLFAVATTVLTGLVFGLAPAVRLLRADLQNSLKEGAKGTVGAERLRLRNGFVVAQLALAAVLVIGAGLLLRSFAELQDTDPGFNPEGVLTMQLNLSNQAYPNDEDVYQFYGLLMDRFGTLPGITAAGMASALPLGESLDYQATFLIVDRPPPEAGEQNRAYFRQVDPGFFNTAGVALERGRRFERSDDMDNPGVVVVNDAFARQFFPTEDPIGQKLTNTGLRFGPLGAMLHNEVEIVGIVRDVRYAGLRVDSSPSIYFPHRQAPFRLMNIALRSAGDPRALIGPAREALRAMDAGIPISRTETLQQLLDASLATDRFSMLLAGLFGFIALVLASVGIYGVLSYTVEHRAKELGIRMALGADGGAVRQLVLRHGAILTLIGLGIGLVGAFWLTRFMASQLYGVAATDPLTFGGVVALLAMVALLASYVPVRRATRVDPVIALRND